MLNNKQAKKGSILVAVLLALVVIIIAPLAIGALLGGVWYFGLPLAISCALIIWSILQNIRKSKEADIEIPATINTATAFADVTETASHARNTIIAQWHVNAEMWNAFIRIEKKLRNSDSVYMFIGTIIMGSIGLMLTRGVSLLTAVIFSAGLGCIVVWLRRYFALRNIQAVPPEGYRIIITPDTVFLNSQAYSLLNENRYLRKVHILNTNGLRMIEFTIGWNTRKGPTFDELRIPVPETNFAEAEKIITYFKK